MDIVEFSNGVFTIGYLPDQHVLVHEGKLVYKDLITPSGPSQENRTDKSESPRILRIAMGTGCNMNCSYCLQDTLSEGKVKQSTDALVTLEAISELDLSQCKEIQLWGGEPLLYWRYVKTFVEGLKGYSGMFKIITNATKLTVSHIDWMHETGYQWVIAMSHDALNHNLLRGEDFLTNPVSRKAIDHALVLKEQGARFSFSFNSVLTGKNWDVYNTVKYFNRHYPTIPVNFELITVYDDRIKMFGLLEQLDKFKSSFKQLVTACINNEPGISVNSMYHFGEGVIPVRNGLRDAGIDPTRFSCGVAHTGITSISHQGDLIACHNTYGDPERVYGRVNAIAEADLSNAMDISKRRQCETCTVQRQCQQICPLIERGSELDEINCETRYQYHLTILEAAISSVFEQSDTMVLKKDNRYVTLL